MSDSYFKTVGGGLKLKGGLDLKKPKKHKHKHKHKSKRRDGDADDTADGSASGAAGAGAGAGESSGSGSGAADGSGGGADVVLTPVRGTGRLVTSGTTVHGQGTKLMSEVRAGDAIIVTHPTSLRDESRIVVMVVSDVSMALSSAFSSDLISATQFKYITRPRDPEKEEGEERAKRRKKDSEDEKLAFGTYASGSDGGAQTMTYRVKKATAYGGYTIVTERVEGSKTRSDLLDSRAKKKSDRFCM